MNLIIFICKRKFDDRLDDCIFASEFWFGINSCTIFLYCFSAIVVFFISPRFGDLTRRRLWCILLPQAKKPMMNKGFKAQRDKILLGKEPGTYDLTTGRPKAYDDGYQVSFQKAKVRYSDAEYDALVNKMIVETGSEPDAGMFEDGPEISFHCADMDLAIKIAREYNQKSVWDWAAGDIRINTFYRPDKEN